jgi:hypothetical protein
LPATAIWASFAVSIDRGILFCILPRQVIHRLLNWYWVVCVLVQSVADTHALENVGGADIPAALRRAATLLISRSKQRSGLTSSFVRQAEYQYRTERNIRKPS